MNIETVSIASLMSDPANVRRHGQRNIDTIRASLTRFGQQKPIVVDGNGIVIAGNGTLEAAKSLGWDSIQIVRTSLVGAEAVAFAIADNRTAELAEWDDDALARTLSALQADDATLIEAAGFTGNELADLLANNAPPEQETPPEGFPEYDESIDTNLECPQCHFRWSGPQGAK